SGPLHLLDLFVYGRGDGRVSDVGVDFYEKIPPDNHGLTLGMVHVGGDDGATASDFVPDKFRGDEVGNFCPERLTWVLVMEEIARTLAIGDGLESGFAAEVFTDRDIFHFRSDEALFGIPHLGHRMSGRGAERFAH